MSNTDTTTDDASSTLKLNLPIIDFHKFINKSEDQAAYKEECVKVADCLYKYGIVILRDPNVVEENNETFLTMMESYFEGSDGVRDARPEVHYQVGVTPNHTEKPRNHCPRMGALGPNDKPLSPCPPEKDPKWRFFWRIGPNAEKTDFPNLNHEPVIPPEFPQWTDVMNMWGEKMKDACFTLAEMAAVGFELDSDAFTSRMLYGAHLLAPTGSDFNKYGAEGTVLAGYHYDLNFMTIHGKSRFPGLNVWTRDGRRANVVIPDGCLILQAGKQLEYLTGGHVLAGFHEVIVTKDTRRVIEERTKAGKSLWRISSTLFSQICSDQVLQPLSPFDKLEGVAEKYPPIKAGHQVEQELQAIELF